MIQPYHDLLAEILLLALDDMSQVTEGSRQSWPKRRIEAAKWFLGVDEDQLNEDGRPGISLSFIAKTFSLDPGRIREAVQAELRIEIEQEKIIQKQISRREKLKSGIMEAMSSNG